MLRKKVAKQFNLILHLLKKLINIDDPLPVIADKIRRNKFEAEKPFTWPVSFYPFRSALLKDRLLKKIMFITFFFLITFRAVAPDQKPIFIQEPLPVEPFSKLMYAIGMVETRGNTQAYNEFEHAAGIFQIRQVRLDDYNRLTGQYYTLQDVFKYEISEKVFLYFASLIGPYDLEKIAKAWNGSGPKTELYWKRIKEYL